MISAIVRMYKNTFLAVSKKKQVKTALAANQDDKCYLQHRFEHDFQHNTPGFREIILQIDSKFLRNIEPLSLLVR